MLEQVMRERAPRLLAYAAMLTGDDAEAHDVFQDALVRTFSRGRRFDHVNAAEAYVRRALQGLGPRERTCIVLRFYDDLTVPQMDDATAGFAAEDFAGGNGRGVVSRVRRRRTVRAVGAGGVSAVAAGALAVRSA